MPVAAFKVGLVGSVENVAIIAEIVSDYPDIPLVFDPGAGLRAWRRACQRRELIGDPRDAAAADDRPDAEQHGGAPSAEEDEGRGGAPTSRPAPAPDRGGAANMCW